MKLRIIDAYALDLQMERAAPMQMEIGMRSIYVRSCWREGKDTVMRQVSEFCPAISMSMLYVRVCTQSGRSLAVYLLYFCVHSRLERTKHRDPLYSNLFVFCLCFFHHCSFSLDSPQWCGLPSPGNGSKHIDLGGSLGLHARHHCAPGS